MSSTWIHDIKANSFPTSAGPAYVVHELTCESNVVPRQPRWSCSAAGSQRMLVPRYAGYPYWCDDGALRGPNGRLINGVKLLQRYYTALRQATPLQSKICMQFGNGFDDLPLSTLEAFLEDMELTGVTAPFIIQSKDFSGSHCATVEFNPQSGQHGDALVRFLARKLPGVYPYRIFKRQECAAGAAATPGLPPELSCEQIDVERRLALSHITRYRPVKVAKSFAPADMEHASAVLFSPDGSLVSRTPARWFLYDYLLHREAEMFGSTPGALKAFASWMDGAPLIPVQQLGSITGRDNTDATARPSVLAEADVYNALVYGFSWEDIKLVETEPLQQELELFAA